MKYKDQIQMIDDYFKNLTVEQFEEDLIKCGYGIIKPASESGYRLATSEEVKLLKKRKD